MALETLLKRKWSSESWLNMLPVGVYSCDTEGRIVQYNRRAAEIWGREPAAGEKDQRFCGSYKLFWPDGRELAHDQTPMAQVLRTGVPAHDQKVVILRPDGTRVVALVNIDPLVDDAGKLVGAVNCFQDVTELERATAQQLEEQRRLSEILGALPAAIYITDAEGRLTYFNEAATELSGRRPALGEDKWCVTLKLYTPDGEYLPHDECPMARAITTQIALAGEEAVAERPDGTRVPFLAYPTPLFDQDGKLSGAVNMLVDISERKKAEDAQRLLIHELNHRVKNTLATVQSIARQTLRRARSVDDFVQAFSGRVNALAHAHTLLTGNTWSGADLRSTLRTQLGMNERPDDRVSLSGPRVMLNPQQALHMSLVLHELWTNASKHGALSVPSGRISVTWRVTGGDPDVLELAWMESGGPEVSAPIRRGFGSALIEKSLVAEQGKTALSYESEGLVCRISLPLAETVAPGEAAAPKSVADPLRPAPDAAPKRPLAGQRVLVVEDEPFVAMDIEAMLGDAGCTVVGPAGDHDSALALAREAVLDAALLDANLAGQPVDEIAAELTRRGVPFAFASGYGRDGLPEAFRQAPLLAKPFSEAEMLKTLQALRHDAPRIAGRRSV